MSNQDKYLLDAWAWLNFKPAFGHGHRTGWQAPTWIGEHFRRLQAYKILESYYKNSSRNWLDPSVEQEDVDSRREYGDPQTVISSIMSSVVGDKQTILVGDTEEEQDSDRAKSQLERIHHWAKLEKFWLKMLEAERTSVKLGDSLYVLGWDPEAKRPRLNVWDPGFYFPVLDPSNPSDQFPQKIHLAYEYEEETPDRKTRYVRRITWELVEMDTPLNLPWNEGPTDTHCLMSDGTWRLDDQKGTVEDFTEEKVDWAVYTDPETGEEEPFVDIDLEIDFIPIIHMPNTPALQEHFGTSSIASVLQLFDDIVSTDTDLQAASATTGTPPIALAGSTAPKDEDGRITTYGPGTVLETGDGTATVIDTSRSLDALLKYNDQLLSRLSVNSRVPESMLGRVKPSEVPSGIALSLSFSPHSSMIDEMRLVRDEKYHLLFKFVLRMMQVYGDLDDGEVIETHLKFGTFLPSDKKETVDLVVQLLNTSPPSVSIETTIRMLIEAGFPIEDAAKEVERIIKADFKSAGELLDATADTAAVRKRLGMPEAAPITLPNDNPALPEIDQPNADFPPPPGALPEQ